jgi:iron complex transport system substrate-binding protein
MLFNRYLMRLLGLVLGALFLVLFISQTIMAQQGHALTSRDDTGQVVHFIEPPKRIVSLAPNMTEILFSIGAGNQVVGVTDFCDYPKEARRKARVGGGQIQLEAVLALKPDLVVANADLQPGVIKQLHRLGVIVAAYRPHDWNSVIQTIKRLGLITGRNTSALGLIRKMNAKKMSVMKKMEGRKRYRVFIEVWNKPLMTAGPGTFLHELIVMAGGVDISSDLKRPWAVVSAEDVLRKDPEIIILTCKNKQELLHRSGWEGVTALREGRVYEVDPDIFSRPGPRLADALDCLAGILNQVDDGGSTSKEDMP